MGPLLLLALATSAVAVAAAAGGSKPSETGVVTKDWSKVQKLQRSFPPPPPYYPPNIARAHYPLVWWANDADTTPTPGNLAMDVTGTPWTGIRFARNVAIFEATQRPWTGGLGSACDSYNLGQVFDPATRTWASCDPADTTNADKDHLDMWLQSTWHDEDTFGETLVAAAERYFIPMVITIAGTAIGGAGGAVFAFAATSIWNIASGMKISDALVGAYQERLASTVEKTAYYETFKKVSDTYKQTRSDLEAIRAEALKLYGYKGLNDQNLNEAVTAAIGVARSKQLQDTAIAAVNARLSADERIWLAECLKRGAYLQDWVLAMFGVDGADFLKWAFATATRALDSGKDPIAAVKPAISRAVISALGKAMATTSTGGPFPAPRPRQLATTRRKAA